MRKCHDGFSSSFESYFVWKNCLWWTRCMGRVLPFHFTAREQTGSFPEIPTMAPLVHPHFQLLLEVSTSIPTFSVLCLILPLTFDLAVLIWITFANRRSNSFLADIGLRQRSFRTFFDTLESLSFLTLLCLLQLLPLVFISGKEISMKIYGLNTVTAVSVIWGKRRLSVTSCNCGFPSSSS